MNDKIIIGIIVAATLGIVGIAVLQQQKRLPELEARRPPAPVTPPPGLDEGKASPLEFAKLFENLKPAKQDCFREQFGEERLNQILNSPVYTPSEEDNSIIGQCLLAGAVFEESGPEPSRE